MILKYLALVWVIDMSLHSDTLFWFWCCMLSGKATNTSFVVFGFDSTGDRTHNLPHSRQYLIRRAVILVIIRVKTFKTDVIVFISNIIMCLILHWSEIFSFSVGFKRYIFSGTNKGMFGRLFWNNSLLYTAISSFMRCVMYWYI
jgi:hypothetical protein